MSSSQKWLSFLLLFNTKKKKKIFLFLSAPSDTNQMGCLERFRPSLSYALSFVRIVEVPQALSKGIAKSRRPAVL